MNEDWAKSIRDCWGERLVCFGEADLAGLDLRSEDAEILRAVGLPNFDFNFALNFRVADRLACVSRKGERYLLLGDNSGNALGLAVAIAKTSSELFRLDVDDEDGPLFFVNTDLASFLSFMRLFYEFLHRYVGLSSDDWAARKHDALGALRATLLAVDSRAVLEEDAYWSIYLSEAELD